MPRIPRIVIPDTPHHVTHRGNNRQDIFLSDNERLLYISLLKSNCTKQNVRIFAYCLMSNHVHLVVVPGNENSLSKGIGRAHYEYTQRVNYTRNTTGHIWENRFFSCPLDDSHLWNALVYVERNPVRAGLVQSPLEYPWSSARSHFRGNDDLDLLDLKFWSEFSQGIEWVEILEEEEPYDRLDSIRKCTQSGFPLGNESFIQSVESRLGRKLKRPKFF